MVATEVPLSLRLKPLDGEARPLEEWMITFQMLSVVLDPYTYESAWLLETAGRILTSFRDASVRDSFIITCSEDDARRFLGPWTDEVLTFVDPERELVKACGFETLPAFVHIRQNGSIEAAAEGWNPPEWRAIAQRVAKERNWTFPLIPSPKDPEPYPGTRALPA